jgi:tetratricopeptide (TPR) repeat protein
MCQVIFTVLTICLICVLPSGAEDSRDAVRLNNEGVAVLEATVTMKNGTGHYKKNLTDKDWSAIFDKFEAALNTDPQNDLARKNLAIAHNNFAMYLMLKRRFNDALKQFELSLYLDPSNRTTEGNMDRSLPKMGKHPNSFLDRVDLGNKAKDEKDWPAAVVEYGAALKLRNDRNVHKQLGDIYRLLGKKDKAVSEFAAAYKDAE